MEVTPEFGSSKCVPWAPDLVDFSHDGCFGNKLSFCFNGTITHATQHQKTKTLGRKKTSPIFKSSLRSVQFEGTRVGPQSEPASGQAVPQLSSIQSFLGS